MVVRHCRAWVAVVVTAAAVPIAPSSVSAAGLSLSGPTSAVGDGMTPITFRLTGEPALSKTEANRVGLSADAGSLGKVQASADGSFEVVYTPPRTAIDLDVQLTASLRGARGTASARLRVDAPTTKVELMTSAGALELQFPERLFLGVDESVEVSLVDRGGARPSLWVSVGSLSPLERGRDGRYRGIYTLPDQKSPGVLLAVAETGAVVDWLSIPLFGQGRVTVTTEARADVVVRVGDIEFGPVRAGGAGKAFVAVAAPPGVKSGTAIVTDVFGVTSRTKLDLGVPAYNRIQAVCPLGAKRLLVFAVDARGRPAEGAELDVSTSVGELSRAKVLQPGVYGWDFDLPLDADRAMLSAALRGHEPSKSQCEAVFTGEAPTAMRVVASATHAAGSGPLRLALEMNYPGKRRPGASPPELSVDVGEVGEVRAADGGQFAATWSIPDRREGRTEATVTARFPSTVPPLEAKWKLALEPGPLASLSVSASETELPVDGVSSTTLTLRGVDEFGNPVTPRAVSFDSLGSVSDVRPRSDGVATARYVAPADAASSIDRIVVRSREGDVEGDTTITLRSAPGRLRIAARAGYLNNFGKISAPMVLANGEVRLPMLEDRLIAGVESGLYASSTTEAAEGTSEPVDISVRAVPLNARLSYQVHLGPVAAYLGARGGLLFVTTETSSETTGVASGTNVAPMVGGLLGGELALGPGLVGLEIGYSFANLDRAELAGNAQGANATLGYVLELL